MQRQSTFRMDPFRSAVWQVRVIGIPMAHIRPRRVWRSRRQRDLIPAIPPRVPTFGYPSVSSNDRESRDHPTSPRRRRHDAEYEDGQRSSLGKKLAVILAFCFLIVAVDHLHRAVELGTGGAGTSPGCEIGPCFTSAG